MKKSISFILTAIMCFSIFGTVFASELNFTDVKTSDWFYNDVKSAVEMSLVNGKSETIYAPEDNLTYAEAIKLAACMNQLYIEGVVSFESGTPWYMPYVDYCVDNGIIEKEYNYDDFATRAGYMGIFAKALPDDGLKEINIVPDDSIPDVPSSRAYAPAVYKLYRAGILTGVDAAHNCNPLANITRAEVAAILTRMMNETKRVEITDMGEAEEKKPEEKDPEEKEHEEKDPEVKEPETTEPEVKALAIKTQPVAASIKVGETATITVEAEGGKAPYTYIWQSKATKGFMNLVDGEAVSGATTATLSYTKTVEYSGEFKCVITDANGDKVTSETVTIQFTAESSDVAKALAIKTQPESVSVAADTEVTFAVEVDGGKAPYTYKWQTNRNGGDFYDINKGTFNFHEGFDTATYKVKLSQAVIDSKQGFRCIITDADGTTITSEGATVSANSSPLGTRPSVSRPSTVTRPSTKSTLAIADQSKDMSGSVGLFKLDVTVEGGKAPYTCQWQKLTTIINGTQGTQGYVNLTDTEGTIKGATTANLTVSITTLGTYKYVCVVTDADGNSVTSEVITLTVNSESAGGRVSIPSSGKTGY